MKKKTQNNESVPPWEETPEEPQRITAQQASAAAAVIPGNDSFTGNRAANRETRGNRESSPAGSTAGGSGSKTAAKSGTAKSGTKAASRWQPSLMGYSWVIRNISFLLFLAALAVIYIYNGHYADKLSRDLNRTNKELKELQYEYKTLKSEVMFRSKQSELARAVEPFGLKQLTQPPFVLIDSVQK